MVLEAGTKVMNPRQELAEFLGYMTIGTGLALVWVAIRVLYLLRGKE